MAYDVFVSYSSKDKPTADAVCAVLESHGIRCWVAPRDILPGRDWGGSIIEAIKGARVMVLVFSANANTSTQIKREVERAVNKGIPVIPLRIEDVTPTETLEYFLSTPHWLDAFTPPLEQHLEYLVDVVQKIIGQPSAVAGKKRELSATPVKSTQATPATPPAPSSSSIAASKEPRVWTRARLIIISAIVLFLLALAASFMWPVHRKASKQGNQPAEPQSADQGNANAQFNLGKRYENGEGVPKDLSKAAELYQKAADQGYAPAQQGLGYLYKFGQGVPQDLGKARELFQKAADQEYAAAQNSLGYLYQYGEGVPTDPGKARELYQKAADQGHADAQYRLGLLYEYGEGVPKDSGKAIELFQKAADQGHQQAIAEHKRLSEFIEAASRLKP
jgi:TPR repeat protein